MIKFENLKHFLIAKDISKISLCLGKIFKKLLKVFTQTIS